MSAYKRLPELPMDASREQCFEYATVIALRSDDIFSMLSLRAVEERLTRLYLERWYADVENPQ